MNYIKWSVLPLAFLLSIMACGSLEPVVTVSGALEFTEFNSIFDRVKNTNEIPFKVKPLPCPIIKDCEDFEDLVESLWGVERNNPFEATINFTTGKNSIAELEIHPQPEGQALTEDDYTFTILQPEYLGTANMEVPSEIDLFKTTNCS